MQLALRLIGMIIGFGAAVIMLIVNILYSLSHVLGRAAGITGDTSHFWYGLLFTIVGFVGALLAPFSWSGSVLLMLVAAVGFFFIVGWWAIIPAIFYVAAMLLVYRDHGRDVRTNDRMPTSA
ncbi:MAG TPA: hypothetical protein VIC27_10005 [Ktedonobacterales bacterium]|jgi:hypothetical protein